MSRELSSLGRLRVAIESGLSAYGVDQSASTANFIDVPVTEGSVQSTRTWEKVDPNVMQETLDNRELLTLGIKTCGVNFSTYLCGTGVAYTGAVTLPTTANSAFLRIASTVMGGLLTPSSPGSALVSAATGTSTTTRIYLTAGRGTAGGFTSGGGVMCTINGRVEAREILATSADYVDVKVAFSSIPANGSQVYSMLTIYLTQNPVDSLQFMHDGMENGDKFCLRGLQGGIAYDLTNNGIPKANFTLSGAGWSKLASAAIAVGTPTNVGYSVHMDDEFIVSAVGSTVRNLVHVSQDSWAPGFSYIDVTSTAANNGSNILHKHRARSSPNAIAGKFTMYEDSSAYDFDAAESARTRLAMFRQIGSVAGNVVLLSAPTVQIKSTAKADANGMAAREVEWVGYDDYETYPGVATNTLYRASAHKIHIG